MTTVKGAGSLAPTHPDSATIAGVAREVSRRLGGTQVEIWYRYGAGGRRLRVFPGGWWDSEVRRNHEGERGPRS